jgi:hypothetical protein
VNVRIAGFHVVGFHAGQPARQMERVELVGA